MKWLTMLFGIISFAIACGSHAPSGSNSTVAKTNVKVANITPYSRTENAYTFAQNSDLARELTSSGKEAREIVGKTVTESKLWDNKRFNGELRKLMGRDYATMRKFWNTETPIKKFGDFLMMTGCAQQNCAENRYVIFVDLGAGIINVTHIGIGADKEWNLYRKIEYLPPPFEEELAEMKSRE